MKKMNNLFKKSALAILVLAISLAALPLSGVSAAGLNTPVNPPVSQPGNLLLERVWIRLQLRYEREGNLLAQADAFIANAQALIEKAAQKGWDTSAVQAALDAFSAVIPAAQAAHDRGAVLVNSHEGFDANGKVTDRATAVTTTKALAQVLKDTRAAMDGTGRALRQAVRAFRQAHRNAGTPTP